MRNLMKICVAVVLVAVSVLAGCGAQRAVLKPRVDGGIEVERSFWASDPNESLGELGINLAKTLKTTENNAVYMSSAQRTKVSTSTRYWGHGGQTATSATSSTSIQFDFERRRQQLMKRFVEVGKPQPQNFVQPQEAQLEK